MNLKMKRRTARIFERKDRCVIDSIETYQTPFAGQVALDEDHGLLRTVLFGFLERLIILGA